MLQKELVCRQAEQKCLFSVVPRYRTSTVRQVHVLELNQTKIGFQQHSIHTGLASSRLKLLNLYCPILFATVTKRETIGLMIIRWKLLEKWNRRFRVFRIEVYLFTCVDDSTSRLLEMKTIFSHLQPKIIPYLISCHPTRSQQHIFVT